MTIDELKLMLLSRPISEVKKSLKHFDIDSIDKNGNNILLYFLKSDTSRQLGAKNIVQLFIDVGIDINAKQTKMSKRTALQIATIKKSKDIFDVLLKNGADINIKDQDGNTALSHAVFTYRGDDGYFIETLISKGAHVDAMNNYGVSPKALSEIIANYDTKKFFQ